MTPTALRAISVAILASLISGDVSGQLTNPQPPICGEPHDVMEMYRNLTSQNIDHASEAYHNGNPNVATVEIDQFYRNVQVKSLDALRCLGYSARKCSCPQKYDVNFDANRVPKVLLQSSCCHRNQHRGANWILECRNVVHHIPVLRRTTCIDGVYQYEKMWEDLPVGCSCFSMPMTWRWQ